MGTLPNQNKLLFGLLLFIVLGIITNLDYSNSCGCIIETAPILSWRLVNYLSFPLVIIALLLKNINWVKSVLVTETVFWLFRLFVLKGGYAVGFGGSVSPEILSHDFLGVFFRLIILFQLFDVKKYRIVTALVITILVIQTKNMFFPCPVLNLFS